MPTGTGEQSRGRRICTAGIPRLVKRLRPELVNLDRPLRLSELEARSHYSSLALQYAFRELLGCLQR